LKIAAWTCPEDRLHLSSRRRHRAGAASCASNRSGHHCGRGFTWCERLLTPRPQGPSRLPATATAAGRVLPVPELTPRLYRLWPTGPGWA